ncbi:MAG: hypothetical protein SPL63_04780 [Roseburia faecis]|nr:hypothetical protein [Agathobacter sp.]MDY6279418.1 hypothetical protein [Roseburia faecis]
MQKFDYCTPTRLIFGQGAVEKLPEVMSRYGKKILMTYGGGSIKKIYAKMVLVLSMHGGKGKRHRDALCLCRWKGKQHGSEKSQLRIINFL